MFTVFILKTFLLQYLLHHLYSKVSSIIIANISLTATIVIIRISLFINGSIIGFSSNNDKGIQMSQKRIKLFEYLELCNIKRVCFPSRNTLVNYWWKEMGESIQMKTCFLSQKNKFIHSCDWLLWNQKVKSN